MLKNYNKEGQKLPLFGVGPYMVCYHADHGVKGEIEKMKIMLLLATVGHLICGITDGMFAYSKAGRFDYRNRRRYRSIWKRWYTRR